MRPKPVAASNTTTLARLTRDQLMNMHYGCVGNVLDGVRTENRTVRLLKELQSLIESGQGLFRLLALRDIALDAEVPGDSSVGIVEANVVAFHPHAAAVEPALVTFHVDAACVKHSPPQISAVSEIVNEEVVRRATEKLRRRSPVLCEQRLIDLDHVLMLEDIVQHRFLIHVWAPANRFIEHHEKEAIQRLREEQFQVAERLAQFLLSLASAIRFQRQGGEVSQRSRQSSVRLSSSDAALP